MSSKVGKVYASNKSEKMKRNDECMIGLLEIYKQKSTYDWFFDSSSTIGSPFILFS